MITLYPTWFTELLHPVGTGAQMIDMASPNLIMSFNSLKQTITSTKQESAKTD